MSEPSGVVAPINCSECGCRFRDGDPVRMMYYDRYQFWLCDPCYRYQCDMRAARRDFDESFGVMNQRDGGCDE